MDDGVPLPPESAGWFRPVVDRQVLRELAVQRRWRGAVHVTAFFALLAALAAAIISLWWTWWVVPLLLVYGNVWTLGSIAMEHEALHSTLVRSKRANRALAHVGGFMCGLEATRYRWTHFGHHSQTLQTSDPRDYETLTSGVAIDLTVLAQQLVPLGGLVRPRKAFWYWQREVLRNATGRLTFVTEHGVRAKEHPAVIRNARIHVAIWAGTSVASIALWSPLPLLLLVLPSWYGSTLFVLCGFTQHAGLPQDVRDHRRNTRSFTTNPVLSFLYFGMQHHVEHHLYPQVPSYRLAELHQVLQDQLPTPRRGLIGAWREVLPALRRRQHEPTWFVDVPVPPAAGSL